MTVDKAVLQEVNLSLARCILHSGFFEKFYENFKASDPSIPPFFRNTDMAKQRKLLKDGLAFLLMSAGGSTFALTEIRKLGIKHDPSHLNVRPELYRHWVEALMKTVKVFDHSFTSDLDRKWRAVLEVSIKQMTDAYEAQAETKKA